MPVIEDYRLKIEDWRLNPHVLATPNLLDGRVSPWSGILITDYGLRITDCLFEDLDLGTLDLPAGLERFIFDALPGGWVGIFNLQSSIFNQSAGGLAESAIRNPQSATALRTGGWESSIFNLQSSIRERS